MQDGFYDSISFLKSISQESISSSHTFQSFSEDYANIMEICSHGEELPPISVDKASDILHSVKPHVTDLYSITAKHYINAGESGILHFCKLLNLLIHDINSISIPELNAVYAIILFKGHNKEKNLARSYRTISTCPFLAKVLDLYVRDLNLKAWNSDQADTQFQGEGSSHELASLLLTECVQHSLHTLKKPLFALYLDAQSAFDVVLRELLVKNLYFCGTSKSSILYIDSRLKNRTTFLDWNRTVMGPIFDECGLEQGGVNSSEYYKIFGKEQLSNAQMSDLGVTLGGDITVAAIGQADDTVLVSNDIHNIQNLLDLTLDFCSKYHVQLCIDKTKLQVTANKELETVVDYQKATSPVNISGKKISFVESVEHVGILRSSSGNLPSVLKQITAHKRQLGSILHTGMARGHHGNPAASLRVLRIYGLPVLMSGLGTLVLNKPEKDIVNQHYKATLESLMRLHKSTPACVVYFLAGSLPGLALLHLKQLSLLGMVTRLQGSILHNHAMNVYRRGKPSSRSWFLQVRDICLQYSLPHPSTLLEFPLTKLAFKNLVKKAVVSFWEKKLRDDAKSLKSLEHFRPEYMSLSVPHPIWLTAMSSSYEVIKAKVQAKMLSGR